MYPPHRGVAPAGCGPLRLRRRTRAAYRRPDLLRRIAIHSHRAGNRSAQRLNKLVTVTPGGMQTEVKALATPVNIVTAQDIERQLALGDR